MMDKILDEVTLYTEDESKSFLILEAQNLPFFLQIAKISEDMLLDVPASILYSEELEAQLLELMQNRYR